MNSKCKSTETGQLLVILSVGLVVLIGFAALAIDGGMVFSERRNDQNGADAAALAGGWSGIKYMDQNDIIITNFSCATFAEGTTANSQIKSASFSRAADNGFSNTPVPNTVQVIFPDIDINGNPVCYDTGYDRYIDLRVHIEKDVQTSLIQFVYTGPVRNTVDAVTRIRPSSPFGVGNTIVGLRGCTGKNDPTVTVEGSTQVRITNGGIYSNGFLTISGLNSTPPDFSVNVNPGAIEHRCGDEGYTANGNPSVYPDPTTVTELFKRPTITNPCPLDPDPKDFSKVTGGKIINLSPGLYDSISVTGNAELNMAAGLYCLYGDFKATSGKVQGPSPSELLAGKGVTIYLSKTLGNNPKDTSFYVSATDNGKGEYVAPNVTLSAPVDTIDGTTCGKAEGGAIKGLLVALADGNRGSIDLLGDSTSQYNGTIFAPDGTINIGGAHNLDTKMGISAIGDTIKLHGNVNLDLTPNPDDLACLAAAMDLTK